jgi:GNAT superfamily N-acetyltransferase
MTPLLWHEEPISRGHPRGVFDCGDADLNTYLHKFARQNHESGGAKTFLAIDDVSGRVLGFYSVAPAVAEYERTPEGVRLGLPRHAVPGFRLARLATDRSAQGNGLGGQLLLAAGKRCLRVAAEVGGVALHIDAKNERVAAWYASFGAQRLLGETIATQIPMVLPLKTIAAVLTAAGKL